MLAAAPEPQQRPETVSYKVRPHSLAVAVGHGRQANMLLDDRQAVRTKKACEH